MALLDGKVIVVTGAGGGLGRSYALALAREGARVVVNDLGSDVTGASSGNPARAQTVAKQIRALGGEAIESPHDVASEEGAQAVIDTALKSWGQLDGVVNNAGNIRATPMPGASLEDFRAIIDVHLVGTFLVSRAAAAHWTSVAKSGMRVDARLVNTTSSAGLWGMPGAVAYCAAKGGILSLSQCLTAELARYGVRVNCVGPGAGTRMNTRRDGDENDHRALPLRSALPDVDACAPLMVWLMSHDSAHVTGRTFENIGGSVWFLDGWRRKVRVAPDPTCALPVLFTRYRDAVAAAPEPEGALGAVDYSAVADPTPGAIRPPLHHFPSGD
jgi:NAD(P)-dependent dehydrogenase (short-subunit alcohol dehydrogenase family)